MRYVISLFLILGLFTFCYADRICVERTTGKLIEYQSGDAPLGALTKNAVRAGYHEDTIEERYITAQQWSIIRDEQITKPAKEKAKQEEQDRKQKEESIKAKLNLSDKDFQDLRGALK